jgi:hypothetical protein
VVAEPGSERASVIGNCPVNDDPDPWMLVNLVNRRRFIKEKEQLPQQARFGTRARIIRRVCTKHKGEGNGVPFAFSGPTGDLLFGRRGPVLFR